MPNGWQEHDDPVVATRQGARMALGLGTAVLAGLVVTAGIAGPAPVSQPAGSPPLSGMVSAFGPATTCCPPTPTDPA